MGTEWSGRWHCNPETGNVGRCYAQQGKCPFPDAFHSIYPGSALDAFAKYMEPEKLVKLTRGRPKLKELSTEDEKVFQLFSLAKDRPDLNTLDS